MGQVIRKSLPGLVLVIVAATIAIPFAVGHDDRGSATVGTKGASACDPLAAGSSGDFSHTGSPAIGLEAMDVSAGARSGEVAIACTEGRPATIDAGIEPGQKVMIVLVIDNDSDSPAHFQIDPYEADSTGGNWIEINPTSGSVPPGNRFHVGITLSVPSGLATGSVQELDLNLDVTGTEGFFTRLPVTMTVREEQPLFRDRFDVDPVLGQFSHVDSGTADNPVMR